MLLKSWRQKSVKEIPLQDLAILVRGCCTHLECSLAVSNEDIKDYRLHCFKPLQVFKYG